MSRQPGHLPAQVSAALDRLDDLVSAFEVDPDDAVQERLIEVLRAVDVIHRGALHRLGAVLDAHGLREDALSDPHVALVFDLYEEQDDDADPRARAEAAVASIRPHVEARGGRLELVAADDGVVNVRLVGPCQSCSGGAAELHGLVESALRANLPEFVRMDLAAPARAPLTTGQSPVLIPLSSLKRRAHRPQVGRTPTPGGDGSGSGPSCG